MTNSQNKNSNLLNSPEETQKTFQESSVQNKKRRSWLGSSSNFCERLYDDSEEPLFYGDGHSGWNR